MNFSHQREPHQTQNMDFIHTFPVLQRRRWGPANMERLPRTPAVTQQGVLSVLDSGAVVISLRQCVL